MAYLKLLNEKFPIRKSNVEKQAFRAWVIREAEKLGYEARVERSGGKHDNVVIGNPDKAQATFTAHYDTPACMGMPNIMIPRNPVLFFAYQMLVVGLMLIVCFGVGLTAGIVWQSERIGLLLGYALYMGMLMLLLHGPANRHNANDNTSGVSTVLELMALVDPEQRRKVAFILFDNEEKGLRGSKAFAKDHQEFQCTHLVINMDCVGVGEDILVIAKKFAALHPQYAKLEAAMGAQGQRKVHFFGHVGSVCNSDQKSFQCGVAVMACKKLPVVGYYTPWLHTGRDTQADEGNVACIAQGMAQFVSSLDEA